MSLKEKFKSIRDNYVIRQVQRAEIPEFELRLREFMDNRYENVLTQIRTTGKLEGETEQTLKTALDQLLEEFRKEN